MTLFIILNISEERVGILKDYAHVGSLSKNWKTSLLKTSISNEKEEEVFFKKAVKEDRTNMVPRTKDNLLDIAT